MAVSLIAWTTETARYPLLIRPGTSDVDLFGHLFLRQEYRTLTECEGVRSILDLGANTGLAAAYLLTQFPEASLLAVEPDPENFALCQRNLAPYGERARCVLGAAWSTCTRLRLVRGVYRDGRDWATQVAPSKNGEPAEVEAWDMPQLLEWMAVPRLDLLKIDIERAEIELFRGDASAWLPRVRHIAIELHDAACSRVFEKALAGYTCRRSYAADLTFCLDLRRAAE